MNCHGCHRLNTSDRLRCASCEHEFTRHALERLGHLEFLIRQLRVWAREGAVGLPTRVLMLGLIRAETASLKNELKLATPRPRADATDEVDASAALDPSQAVPAVEFARWLYRNRVLQS